MERPKASEMDELFWLVAKREAPYQNVRTLVLDSGTEMVTKDLEATTLRNLPKTSRDGKQRTSVDDHWLQDRGESSARMARIFRWFRDLPCHLVVTAHPKFVYPKSDDGGVRDDAEPLAVTPAFGPALFRHVAGYSDFCWFFYPAGDHVKILTRTRGAYFAKTRNDGLAAKLGQVLLWPNGENIVTPMLDLLEGKTDRMPEWASPAPAEPTHESDGGSDED